MRILHTSDWHIGRTFHGHSTIDHLGPVLEALVAVVADRAVDVVVVSGDVFDSAAPAAEYYSVLSKALRALRGAGATVILTSGNHDSATRLGFQSEFAEFAGIHVITRHDQLDRPVSISDEFGPVHFYGIPFLEPSLIRHHYPAEELRSHTQVLRFAMDRIRADLAERGGRSVVMSHCFVVGVAASPAGVDLGAGADAAADAGTRSMPVERDITAGGLDVVPLSTFDGPDYVALGHIHGRATLSPRVRYSGAPLHYSFSEAGKPRGAWLIELDAAGLTVAPGAIGTGAIAPGAIAPHAVAPHAVEWIDLPIPRRLSILTGSIEDLLTDDAYSRFEQDWVSATLTDQARPLDGMRRLQQRFPYCATLEHRPIVVATTSESYGDRIKSKTDGEIVAGFLDFVRNGVGPNDFEKEQISEIIAELGATEMGMAAAL